MSSTPTRLRPARVALLGAIAATGLLLAGCDYFMELLEPGLGDSVEMTHTGGDEPARMAVVDQDGVARSVLVQPTSVEHTRVYLPETVRFRVYHHETNALLAETTCSRVEGKIHDALWFPWENRVECVIR